MTEKGADTAPPVNEAPVTPEVPPAPPASRMSRASSGQASRRGTLRRTPDQPCLNCGDATPGDYCRNCGQPKRKVAVSLGAMIADVVEDQLVINRTLPRSVWCLISRPGFLTAEYVEGRIVRYVSPLRLYLVTSVVFFLLLSSFGLRALDNVNFGDEEGAAPPGEEGLAAGAAALEGIDTTDMPVEAREAVRSAVQQLSERAAEPLPTPPSASAIRAAIDPSGLQPWAREILDNSYEGFTARVIARVADRYGHLPPRQAFREFTREYFEYAPQTVFVLLPIFAFILKLLYIRRRRFYAEHFVFALHVHSLTFLTFIVMLLIGGATVNGWLFLAIMIYVWFAMKRVYGQGWFRTTAKYFTLGFVYTLLLTVASIAPAVIAVLLA